MLFHLKDSPQKLKVEKVNSILIILFYASPSSPQLQKVLNFVQMGAGRRKMLKILFKVLERQNLQNQTIFELYTDDNKSKYSINHKEIFKSAKKRKKL